MGVARGLVSLLFVADIQLGAWAFASWCLFRGWRGFCFLYVEARKTFAIYLIERLSGYYKNFIRTNS
jgi:hypothetical protein